MGMVDSTGSWLAPGYFHLNDHQRLQAIVDYWSGLVEIPAERLPERDDHDAAVRLLHAEARLLDAGRFDSWLNLFTEDCGYGLPPGVICNDPADRRPWIFSDRKGLEGRVAQLRRTGALRRTIRLYSNIEVMIAEPYHLHVFCTFLLRGGDDLTAARMGWNGYILRREVGGWRILLKRVSLYDADLPADNQPIDL